MSPSSPLASGHDNGAGRLRTLAGLVNDVAPVLGTPSGPNGPAVAASTASPRITRARALSHRPRPGSSSSPGGSRPSDDEPRRTATDDSAQPAIDAVADAGEPMDEGHVETWRLVRLAQDGDGEAFGQLYDRYVDTVFRFIYFRVNDRALAEDFTSETFLRALRRISGLQYQGRDIGAWFVTIARNIVLDHMKSARHRLETTTGETIEGHDHERSTEAAVLDTLQSEALMQAIARLGDEQRECVVLRFIQGLSVSETAAVMSKNDGAIKALQHRAVRKLAGLVDRDLR